VLTIAQLPYGKSVAGAGIKDVMRDVMVECLVVQRSESLRIATPANRVLWALVKLMEGKRVQKC
jgi:2-dehydropantoate 2-reductase